MAQPISLGTVLGGRYIVLDEVQTTSDGDHVLGGKDQILGREVTILVPSEAHTARVVENARTMAIGAVDADLHILDLGQSGATPYLVTSFAAPAVLLEELLAEPGTVDDDTLSDDIFGRPRSSSSAGAYVLDDGEPDAPEYEDTAEQDFGRWDDQDDIETAPAAPKVEKRLGRPRRASEASTRATLFDRAAAGRGTEPQQRTQSASGSIDPSYDGDNRFDSYEYDYQSTPAGASRPKSEEPRSSRRSGASSRSGAAAAGTGAAAAASSSSGGSSAARGSSSSRSGHSGGKGRLALIFALLLLLILVGAGIVFGGLGKVFDSGQVFGPEEEPSASASPTEQAVPAPTTVTRLVPDDPTLMADQDATLNQAIDGDPETSWVSYGFSAADYGQLVSSVALAVRFEESTPMHELTIQQTSGTGGSFTVYAADSPSLDGAVEIGQGSFDGPETTVELSDEAAQDDHPYLIVQWTELPSLEEPIADYPYGLRIAEIEVS